MIYQLAEKADFGQIYDLEVLRYGPEKMASFNITKKQFIDAAKDIPSIGFEASGKPIGGAFFVHHELHMAVHPDHHGRWGRLARSMFEWLFKIKNPVTIRIEVDNEKCIRFFEKAGWTYLSADEKFVRFKGSSELLNRPRSKTKRLTGKIDSSTGYSPPHTPNQLDAPASSNV